MGHRAGSTESPKSNRRSFDSLRYAPVAQDDSTYEMKLSDMMLFTVALARADAADFFHALG
jgi:hypothetical protein